MIQHDMNLENQAGAAFRADLNDALKALASQSAGDTAPATTYPFMSWFDTANDQLKQRDGDNANWRVVATVVNGELVPYSQGEALSPYGLKNLLINGNFAINQREYVSGTPTTAPNQFTLDRWYVDLSGESITFSASGNGNQVTAPAGGYSQAVMGENIEGGEYTLSWVGTATAEVNGSPVSNGGRVTLPANANAKVSFIAGTVGKAQLEPGSVKTTFAFRLKAFDLFLCQYYCEVLKSQQSGMAYSAGLLVFGTQFAVRKRVTPVMSAISNGIWVGNNTGAQEVLDTIFTPKEDGYTTDHTFFAGSVTQGFAYVLRDHIHLADAELVI